MRFQTFTPYSHMLGESPWLFYLFAFGRVLLFIGIVALIIWAIKRFSHSSSYNEDSEAFAIVRERYAKGEINKEVYDQLMSDLTYTKSRKRK